MSLLLLYGFGGGGGGVSDGLNSQMGKEFVAIVELFIDSCQRSYGTAPCTASVGVTGTQKCFNTLRTCQDRPNYLSAGNQKKYRFATTDLFELQETGDTPTFPTIRAIDTAPTVLTPGKGLGIRSSVSITLEDTPWTDVGVDPYFRERTYTPDDRGSFWGKFLGRNSNYEGRVCNIYTGYLRDSSYGLPYYRSVNFVKRTYLLGSIAGPDTDGRVSILAQDPLRKTDIDKAQWPVASAVRLVSVVLAEDTTIDYGDADGVINTAFIAGQPYIRIDDEIMEVTGIVDGGGGYWTASVSRSDAPSIYDDSLNIQAEHAVAATVQPCWYFEEQRIDEVLFTLLNTASAMDSAYLPVGEWATEILNAGLDNYTLSALIATPTGVKTLLDELTEHGVYIWWNERTQLVGLKAILPRPFTANPFNDTDHIVAGSVSVAKNTSGRVSQVWLYCSLRFPTLDMDQLQSYGSLVIKRDADAESADEYAQIKIKSIRSRWLPSSKLSVAQQISSRLLRSYRDSKTVVAMSMDAKDDSVWTGDIVGLETIYIQDESGLPLQSNYTVIEVDEVIADTGIQYRYKLQSEVTLDRAGVITPTLDGASPFPDYTAASDVVRLAYAFIAPDADGFSDSTPAYQIQ